MGLRDSIIALSPPWLVRGYDGAAGVAGRLMYAIGLAMDLVVDKVSQATAARRPGIGDPSNLAPLGADRVIPRGIVETDAAYAERLVKAFDAWRFAGTARGVMSQVTAWLDGAAPRVWSSHQYTGQTDWDVYLAGANIDAPPTHSLVAPANWNWDGVTNPKRRWLILDGTGWANSTKKWGDIGLTWGQADISWGLDGPPIGDTVRTILRQWRSAGCNWIWAIVTTDPTYFLETLPAGDPKMPDGNFGDWSKIVAGVRLPARFSVARYISGVDGV